MLQLVRNEREPVPFYDVACSLAGEEEVTRRAAGSVSRGLGLRFSATRVLLCLVALGAGGRDKAS